jgi:hypothetical protein
MAVEANKAAAFAATLEDNGNPIDLPVNTSWQWSTDDDTDQIQVVSLDTSVVNITVVDPPDTRKTLEVTAQTVAPDGNEVQGSVTVDIVPGVTHTYTVSVNQAFPQQLRSRK